MESKYKKRMAESAKLKKEVWKAIRLKYTQTAAAAMLGISKQRVSQILREKKPK